MPHLDKGDLTPRAVAAELSAETRDRMENAARIREQIEAAPPKGCNGCGDPFAPLNSEGQCDQCTIDEVLRPMRDKMSPEAEYPEHFTESDQYEGSYP